MFEHKDMEMKRDFLVHLSTVYTWINPLMKGIHHSLETWRGSRDRDGWKFQG